MALNIPGQQYLARPVTSFYEGKAMREASRANQQAFEIGEQEKRLNQIKIEQLESGAEDPAEVRAREKHRIERTREFLTMARDVQARSLATYTQIKESGSEEDAMAAANAIFDRNRRLVTETFGEEFGVQLDEDGVWSPQEAMASLQTADELLKQMNADAGGDASPINLMDPTTKAVRSYRPDDPNVDKLIESGHIRVGVAQPTGTPEQLGMTRADASDLNKASLERDRIAQGNLGEIGLALAGIQGISDPSGVRGWAGEFFGGLIGQVSESAGDQVARAFTGASSEELAVVRTRAKALTSRLLPSITNEESGRFTDPERELAKEVSGAIDVAQSKQQIASNLSELMGIELRGMYRDARFNRKSFPVDLTNDEGMNEMGSRLSAMGMPESRIIETLTILRSIQTGEMY